MCLRRDERTISTSSTSSIRWAWFLVISLIILQINQYFWKLRMSWVLHICGNFGKSKFWPRKDSNFLSDSVKMKELSYSDGSMKSVKDVGWRMIDVMWWMRGEGGNTKGMTGIGLSSLKLELNLKMYGNSRIYCWHYLVWPKWEKYFTKFTVCVENA